MNNILLINMLVSLLTYYKYIYQLMQSIRDTKPLVHVFAHDIYKIYIACMSSSPETGLPLHLVQLRLRVWPICRHKQSRSPTRTKIFARGPTWSEPPLLQISLDLILEKPKMLNQLRSIGKLYLLRLAWLRLQHLPSSSCKVTLKRPCALSRSCGVVLGVVNN